MNEITRQFSNGQFDLTVTPHPVDGFHVQAPGLARALSVRDAYNLLQGIPDEEKGYSLVSTPGGDQTVGYVTEAGFYRALGARQIGRIQDEAVRARVESFQNWVYREILPSLRMTGAYTVEAPARELTLEEKTLEVLGALNSKVEEQRQQLAIAAPKAEAYNAFLSTSGDYSINEAAKILARDHQIVTGEGRLRTQLEEWGWIYRHNGKPRAKQYQIDLGRMAEKAQWHFHPSSGEKIADTPQVRLTAKGLDAIRSKWMEVAA